MADTNTSIQAFKVTGLKDIRQATEDILKLAGAQKELVRALSGINSSKGQLSTVERVSEAVVRLLDRTEKLSKALASQDKEYLKIKQSGRNFVSIMQEAEEAIKKDSAA